MEESKLLSESKESSSDRYRICMTVCLSFIEILIVVSTGLTIFLYDDDCYRPIRLWMIILMSTFSFHIIVLLISEIILRACPVSTCLSRLYNFINSLVHSFVFIWMLTGSVWLIDDFKDCEEGFMVMMVTLLIYYTLLASVFILIFCVTAIACYGRMKILQYTNEYSEV